jgi:ribonuclease BN (tRNA processing enzyme)
MMRNSLSKRKLSVLYIFSFLLFSTCFVSCGQAIDLEQDNQQVVLPPAPEMNETPEPTQALQQKSDFSAITLGTGGPNYNPKRSGPSTLIRYKDFYFLVDMGNGTQARLNEASIPIGEIATFMFTHHHIDHNEEFDALFIQAWLKKGDNLNIVGPVGTRELYNFAVGYYKEDLAYRSLRIGREFNENIAMNVRELTDGASLKLNGILIRAAQVSHTIPTLAYRFDVEGKSIVISGDTAYSENLVELAKGSDLLVMDSGGVIVKGKPQSNKAVPPSSRRPAQENGKNPSRAHSTLQEIATMAQKAQVKCLVLTHFSRGEVDEEATTTAIGEIYNGTIIYGEDLMEITCPLAASD